MHGMLKLLAGMPSHRQSTSPWLSAEARLLEMQGSIVVVMQAQLTQERLSPYFHRYLVAPRGYVGMLSQSDHPSVSAPSQHELALLQLRNRQACVSDSLSKSRAIETPSFTVCSSCSSQSHIQVSQLWTCLSAADFDRQRHLHS